MLLGNTAMRTIPVIFIERTALVNVTGDAPPQVTVSTAAPSVVDVDSNFDVGIEVTQVSNLNTAVFVLKFNPIVLQVVDVISGSLTPGADIIPRKTIPGQVTVLIYIHGLDGVSGEGSIVIVKFHAIGALGSSSALELSSVQLGNTSEQLIPGVPGPPVLVRVGIIGYGDVNGNGTVSPSDAAMVIKATIGMIELTPIQFEKADVSDDGKVTGYDAALIMQYITGIISKFPAEMGAMSILDE
jgi:hypothetical protein